MLFHEKRKFVFVSVPKTGTTSIENHLVAIDPDIRKNQVKNSEGIWIDVHKHTTARKLRELMGASAFDYRFVAFLRDPRELAVSKYNFYSKGWPYEYWRKGSLPFFGRNERWWRPSLAHRVLFARLCPYIIWIRIYQFKPISHFVLDEEDTLIVDEIGLFDDFQNDFTRIFTNLGYSKSELMLPRENVTPYNPAEFDFDIVDSIVRKRCAMDLRIIQRFRAKKKSYSSNSSTEQ